MVSVAPTRSCAASFWLARPRLEVARLVQHRFGARTQRDAELA